MAFKMLLDLIEYLTLKRGLATTDFTKISFICLVCGATSYYHLMASDDVDNWKSALGLSLFWFFTLIFAVFLSTEDFTLLMEGKLSSIFFGIGLLALALAYTIISFSALSVREHCLVRLILIAIGLLGLYNFLRFANMIITHWKMTH